MKEFLRWLVRLRIRRWGICTANIVTGWLIVRTCLNHINLSTARIHWDCLYCMYYCRCRPTTVPSVDATTNNATSDDDRSNKHNDDYPVIISYYWYNCWYRWNFTYQTHQIWEAVQQSSSPLISQHILSSLHLYYNVYDTINS